MIAIGIGANSKARMSDFAAALREASEQAGGADAVSTLDAAVFANQVREAALQAGILFRPVTIEAMRDRNEDCSTRSERTLALFGVASIAEAAALAGAGPRSRLIVSRRLLENVTIAAARSADKRGPRE